MAVINISQKSEFEDTISSNDLVVVHFYADWATQCDPMNDVLEELAKQAELKAVRFAKCPAEDLPEVSLKYSVSAVPTFLLLRGGSLLDRVDGANAAELTKKINLQISKASNIVSPPPAKATTEDLKTRLHGLINSSPVMLFMKGTATDHKCWYNRAMVALLDSHGAAYKTFDILTDAEVRQELKECSEWSTYPQLCINGEIIGGLDIVTEMDESGELQALLPKKEPLHTRLKSLVNQSTCMVFMKGPREVPRCGFSKQLLAILTETDIKFDTFDILVDEEVRQGLKTFSNWPTYPQVYVKGELIGGLDIIKELKESGELLSALKGEA